VAAEEISRRALARAGLISEGCAFRVHAVIFWLTLGKAAHDGIEHMFDSLAIRPTGCRGSSIKQGKRDKRDKHVLNIKESRDQKPATAEMHRSRSFY
jgi:hypothetical protein